jgi:hypothetical protein
MFSIASELGYIFHCVSMDAPLPLPVDLNREYMPVIRVQGPNSDSGPDSVGSGSQLRTFGSPSS